MLFNKDLGVIYLHNPRTAGMSMTEWLKLRYSFQPYSTVKREFWQRGQDILSDKVPDSELIERHRIIPPEHIKQDCPFVFTVIRHPVVRALSCWRYYINHRLCADNVTFIDWLQGYYDCVPSQLLYVEQASMALRYECLERELAMLPFTAFGSGATFPRINASPAVGLFLAALHGYITSDSLVHQLGCRDRAEILVLAAERYTQELEVLGYSMKHLPCPEWVPTSLRIAGAVW